MMTDYRIEELKAARPILEKIVVDCTGNNELCAIKQEAERLLGIISRCEMFGIWSDSENIKYGIYYGNIENPNCSDYDSGEPLLKISFPTGAYIFGKRYDINFFNEFFAELQEVTPKYIDRINHALYYSPENAKKAYAHYQKTLTKYTEMNSKRKKMWKIEELARQLKELEDEE